MSGGFNNKEDSGLELTAAELLWTQTGSAGVLLLTEQSSAPSGSTSIGKIYTKTSDGGLYFKDSNGVEFSISAGVNSFSDNETPGGIIDGANVTFTLSNAPSPTASLILVLNGQVLTQGVEYTLSGTDITFTTAPDSAYGGLPFKAWYRY